MMVKRGRPTGAAKDQWKQGSQRSGVGGRAVAQEVGAEAEGERGADEGQNAPRRDAAGHDAQRERVSRPR